MGKAESINAKIYTAESFRSTLSIWRFQQKKIVFTNGCFDILHPGHIHYLGKAAELGDVLVIGLNTDNSVTRLKGRKRPINTQDSRATVLAALEFVNAVVFFDEETPGKLIEWINPGVLVKGGDYKTEEIAGHEFVLANGGVVETVDLLPDFSTTRIIEKISDI